MPDPLLEVLAEIQRRGGIGRLDLPTAIAHADEYVTAVRRWHSSPHRLHAAGSARLIDLGSGGGLPALVIAFRCAELEVTMVERRVKRADLLAFGVRALGIGDRVTVMANDVARVISDVADDAARFDIVTARSFAAPTVLLQMARNLVRPGSWVVASEPPAVGHDRPESRWSESVESGEWRDLGRQGAVRVLERLPF